MALMDTDEIAAPAMDGEAPEAFKGRSIETYKRMFRRAEEQHATARELAHRDRDWYDNFDDNQWTDKERAELERRRQPIVTSNRIKRKVNFLCGLEQRQRSDPRAFPREPGDAQSAEVVTKVLDYIETQTRFDATASGGFRDLCVEGIEAAEVIIENGDEVVVNLIDFDSFFYDPRSRKEDFSDAKYLGYQDWFDIDEARELFPGEDAERALEGAFAEGVNDEGYEDKPYGQWSDENRQRVRIACMYWIDGRGAWNHVYFTGIGILTEGPSPYLDAEGRPCCPIIAASAYMTRNNERYGVVRDMISPQREMNYRRSQMLHLMKNRRTWAVSEGILPKNAGEILARADGSLIAKGAYGQDWGFIESHSEVAENAQLLAEAKSEIDVHGPNAGLQGRGTEDQSGRAIALQQNAGVTEENTLYDTHNDWKLRIYRAMWARVKQFWTAEKHIRVTGDEEAPEFIGLNQKTPVQNEMGQVLIDPMTNAPVMTMTNDVARMDVDIVIEAAPDVITLQHEEFQQLAQLAGSGVPIPPDVLLEASQLRNKRELLDRMKEEMSAQAKLKQASEQIGQMQKVIQELQKQLQAAGQGVSPLDQAKMMETMARTENIRAKTETERVGQMSKMADIDSTRVDTATKVRDLTAPVVWPQ